MGFKHEVISQGQSFIGLEVVNTFEMVNRPCPLPFSPAIFLTALVPLKFHFCFPPSCPFYQSDRLDSDRLQSKGLAGQTAPSHGQSEARLFRETLSVIGRANMDAVRWLTNRMIVHTTKGAGRSQVNI